MNTSNCSFQLTANIFYNLLLDAMINKYKQGEKCNENTKGLTQTHMFHDLNVLMKSHVVHLKDDKVYCSDGKLDQGTKNAATKFKSGIFKTKNSQIYNFNKEEKVNLFSQQIENEYQFALNKMTEFTYKYFGEQASNDNITLVKKIIYFIHEDQSISDNQIFYICSDGSTKTKTELIKLSDIEFEPFLLGVWHYLIYSQHLQTKINQSVLTNTDYTRYNIKLQRYKPQQCKDITQNSKTQNSTYHKQSISKIKPTLIRKAHKALIADTCDNYTISVCDQQMSYYPSEMDIYTDIISILEKEDITLSRSIFFKFLSENIQTIHPKRNKNAIEKLFLDLINITIENDCKLNPDKSYLLFHHNNFEVLKAIYKTDGLNDRKQIDKFSVMVKNHYQKILSEVIKIRRKYFNSPEKNEDLVVEIIEFIKNDSSIQDSQKFYVCSDGTHLTKEQLCDIEELEFEPFLLGIWYYVVYLLDSKDNADKHTFDTVFKLNYRYNGKECERYRLSNIISEQSEMFVELEYIRYISI